ncbi:hypothetical protein Fmac_010384 [Flemingia macrophylla]|uniref:Uncharacterized protein n=1 Tax=Flemingia macrophylla TaxID=520843 RepID=A0ABD1MJE8_9FABA
MALMSFDDEMETLFATLPDLFQEVATPITPSENTNADHHHHQDSLIQFFNLAGQSPPPPPPQGNNGIWHAPSSIHQNQNEAPHVQQHSPPLQRTPAVARSPAAERSSSETGTNIRKRRVEPSRDDGSSSSSVFVPRKRVRWTEVEHKLFLLGLEKCGKGDWVNISRRYVKTKTSTQIASHAQKYYLRLDCKKDKRRRRRSIHDISLQDRRRLSHHIRRHLPSPNTIIRQHLNQMHHSLPRHIHQPNLPPSANLGMQQLNNLILQPHLPMQQLNSVHNLVPSDNHQHNNGATSTNLPMQQLNNAHNLISRDSHQQNLATSTNLPMQVSRNNDPQNWVRSPNVPHSVPPHINQHSLAPSTNFTVQQLDSTRHPNSGDIYQQYWTSINIAMQRLRGMASHEPTNQYATAKRWT